MKRGLIMITAITIENFKGISEPVMIEFKPVTLLFGANSTGKSTVFHALYYLHKILTQVGDKRDKVIYYDYADFISMVHDNDPAKDICISLNCNISTSDNHFYALLHMIDSIPSDLIDSEEVNNLIQNIVDHKFSHPNVKVKIHIGVMAEQNRTDPVIKLIEIEFIKTSICIDYRTNKITVTNINNLIVYISHLCEGICGCSNCDKIITEKISAERTPIDIFDEVLLDASGLHSMEMIRREDNNDITISYCGEPLVTSDLHCDTFGIYNNERIRLIQQPFLLKFINILLCGLFDNVAEDLGNALYIKPLRDMPSRSLEYTFSDENSFATVNKWLGREKFDTGLYFENEKQYSISLTNQEYAEIDSINKAELVKRISVASNKLVLKRLNSSQKISLSDVGFGISQLLPIIDAYTRNIVINHRSYSYIFVEQPELHLHPRMQTVLADMIISWCYKMSQYRGDWMSDKEHKTIIETHSEHLLLRILRRIRETTAGELPVGCDPLSTDQLAIYYMEQKDGIVRVRNLDVSPDGDSLGDWPKGFFEERAGELF
jgi:predicted ATPase